MINFLCKNRDNVVCLLVVLTLFGCKDNASDKANKQSEDRTAKKMLQGIWVNSDEEDVAFMAKGDTIFYPDTTSQPVYFRIVNDTLVLHGTDDVKYPIVKQAPHLFIFKNQVGDRVRLTKSNSPTDNFLFNMRRPQALNQNKLIKRDSVVTYMNKRYHWYVQVNPTTYKVVKPTYNGDGVEVDNVYHDNIIHISVFAKAQLLFSHDFRKKDFKRVVPANILNQSILSDMTYDGADVQGIHFNASICIPDNRLISYIVEVVIPYSGKMYMRIAID